MEKYFKINLFIFICVLFYLSGCQKENTNKIKYTPAFYHWQTHLKLTPAERHLLDSLNTKKLYVKFFDIDLNENNEPVPNAQIETDTHLLNDLKIIPTVFITNRTFKDISKKQIEKLADNIFNKIKTLIPDSFNLTSNEIQFDCDWTKTTQDNYFYFLKFLKSKHPKRSNAQTLKLSSTIRLHQLKYPDQTGIPPVDKGMLMFYNMGDLENWETENSILDLEVAQQYLISNTQYPIPLDLALPVFKWGIVFRNNELVYLINNLSEKEMRDSTRFFKINKNRFEVKRSTYLGGYYLYKGDLIRLEEVSPELLNEAGVMLSERFDKFSKFVKSENQETIITFYHLDTTTLSSFRYEDFEKILSQF